MGNSLIFFLAQCLCPFEPPMPKHLWTIITVFSEIFVWGEKINYVFPSTLKEHFHFRNFFFTNFLSHFPPLNYYRFYEIMPYICPAVVDLPDVCCCSFFVNFTTFWLSNLLWCCHIYLIFCSLLCAYAGSSRFWWQK